MLACCRPILVSTANCRILLEFRCIARWQGDTGRVGTFDALMQFAPCLLIFRLALCQGSLRTVPQCSALPRRLQGCAPVRHLLRRSWVPSPRGAPHAGDNPRVCNRPCRLNPQSQVMLCAERLYIGYAPMSCSRWRQDGLQFDVAVFECLVSWHHEDELMLGCRSSSRPFHPCNAPQGGQIGSIRDSGIHQ